MSGDESESSCESSGFFTGFFAWCFAGLGGVGVSAASVRSTSCKSTLTLGFTGFSGLGLAGLAGAGAVALTIGVVEGGVATGGVTDLGCGGAVCAGAGGGGEVPPRQGQHADPLCPVRAAALAVGRLSALDAAGVVEFVGIHAHLGSQVFALAPFAQAIDVLAGFFAPLDLAELVVGGGLGVAYVNGEEAPPMAQWAASVRQACRQAGIGPSVRVTAEPGRSIVASAAMTLYTVGTVKDVTDHRTYVAVDGGMSDNPRPVLYGSGYEAFLPRETPSVRPRAVRVVGKHCESGDVVVADAYVPADLEVGDVLATPVTGAYGHSMASNYNKVPRPAVVFVADGEARTVVRRETFEDLVRLDV